MRQTKNPKFDIEVDKFTNSIENVLTGESFKTQVVPLTAADIKNLHKKDWLFDWKKESNDKSKSVFKLVIVQNPIIIQGLISLEDRKDHIFMYLIESIRFNRGSGKIYHGVAGNLIAFACKLSFEQGYDGFVSFESKTKLISHYQNMLGAKLLFWEHDGNRDPSSSQTGGPLFPINFVYLSMRSESKNIDFNTTGRKPSEQEFELVSKWISSQKSEKASKKGGTPKRTVTTSSKSV